MTFFENNTIRAINSNYDIDMKLFSEKFYIIKKEASLKMLPQAYIFLF